MDDDGESVKLTFVNLPGGVSVGSPAETIVTITDDALPSSVTVSFSSPSYPVTEGEGVEVTVTLSEEPEREIIIPIRRTNQGGASDSDYRGVPDSLTFNATETSKSFTVEAVQDNLEDIGESVKLRFSSTLPAGVTSGTNHEATVSIANGIAQNSLAVNFEVSEYTLTEGDTRMVTVTLSAAPGSEVTIPLVPIGQGGASDSDYKVVPDNVTFNATDTKKSFTFTATDDEEEDDGERVKLTFGTLPGGVSPGTTNETTMTITDRETVMEVSFEKSSYSVDEGHGVEVMVRLDPAPDHQMEIPLQKSNINGTSDNDYYGVPSMLNFERGDTEKTFTIFAELDEENDDGEAVEVSFVALPATVREGDPSKAMVSLRDNGGPSKDGITCIDNNRANIVTVLSGRGVISSAGEVDTWVIPGVDPYRTYLVEILGADSNVDLWGQDVGGGLTLADPHPVSLYHEDGRSGTEGFNSAPGNFGAGRNSRFIFIFSTYGDFVLKVKSGESADDQGTGSYHLLVRYDNYCIVKDNGDIMFPLEGGPEGYAFDIRDDTGTRFVENVQYSTDIHRRPYFAGGHLLGDNWGSEPDEDWIQFELEGDTEYEVYLEGADHYPVEHRLTRPRIVGIFDQDGELFHEGAAGNGTDTSVSLTFQSASNGLYYLGVGSNPGDRTGVYSYHVRQTESNNAGRAATKNAKHAATNNSPTGGPGITGFPRTGKVLTATTSGIADADGLENASFSYQWVRHDPLANTDTDIPGATGSTYTVTRQDQDRAIKVRVEFTDDGRNYETLTSFAFLILPPVNTPATGAPIISGTTQVGQTLTAKTSGISDADGMDNATLGYQWIAGGSDIQNATGMSHTLTEDEEGLAIQVSVTFTDDVGNEEPLTSAPTDLVQPRPNAPVIRGAARVGETLTADTSGISDPDGMDNAVFAYQWVAGGADIDGATGSNYEVAAEDEGLIIQVWVSFADDAGNHETRTSEGAEPVQPETPPNTLAEGAPTITGTAQVGETLTAETTGISDAQGMEKASFAYRWLAGGTDIPGATGSSYTLTKNDEGLAIQVWVSFTDDAGNPEALASSPTGAVAPRNPPPAPENLTGTANSDGSVTLRWEAPDDDSVTGYQILRRKPGEGEDTLLVHVYDTGSTATEYIDNDVTPEVFHAYRVKAINPEGLSSRSNFVNVTPVQPAEPAQNSPATGAPAISGAAHVGETLTAETSGIADDDGLVNATYSYQWIVTDGGADVDIPGATGSSYTLVTADKGLSILVRVSFTDNAHNDETLTSAATDAVEAAPQPNSQPTGQPTIGGIAQVGETLTADTTGIADDDGLTNSTYSYQWVANDGTTDTDISGATDATYTLVADDEGKTIKVKVTFTDDADNDETLTSAATDAVEAAPQSNSQATGQPTISGAARVGETLTAETSDISDAEGMENAVFTYRWMAGGTDIPGATGATYTLTGDDEGLSIQVWVSFTDDADNPETLTSTATDAVEPVPPPLTVSLTGAPATHDGSTEFTFEIEFSEEFPLSFEKLKLHAFDVTDGEVLKAQRTNKPSNISWRITVRPGSNADVNVVLAVTTDCDAQGAICTQDGRKLSNSLNFTVSGPAQ